MPSGRWSRYKSSCTAGFPGKLGSNCRPHLDLPFSNCRCNSASQPWMPAIKSSNGVLSPRLLFRILPFAGIVTGLALRVRLPPGPSGFQLGSFVDRRRLMFAALTSAVRLFTSIHRPKGARLLPGTSVPGRCASPFVFRPEGGRRRSHAQRRAKGMKEARVTGSVSRGFKPLDSELLHLQHNVYVCNGYSNDSTRPKL